MGDQRLGHSELAREVRAAFTGGTAANTVEVTGSVDRQASTAASEDVGPGSVNLLTGDYTIADSDASFFGLSADRSTSSRNPTGGYVEQAQRLNDNNATVEIDTTLFSGVNATIARDTTIRHAGQRR